MSRAAVLCACIAVVAGCARYGYETRPLFRHEYGLETHGRKTWFDHLVEFDPGHIEYSVSGDFEADPPERIAVLPFADHGSAQFVLDKLPLSFRDQEQRAEWAWTYAQRLRRSFTGYLAQREFVPINLIEIDTILQDHGIDTYAKLEEVPKQEFRRWLGADAVVYGEVKHYEAYYALLIAAWQVGVHVKMVSTRDGHEYFTAAGSRYSVDLRPAFDTMDMAINSAMTLLELRDVTLARAEEEVCREIVKRIPQSDTARARLAAQARRDDPDSRNGWAAPVVNSDSSGRLQAQEQRSPAGQASLRHPMPTQGARFRPAPSPRPQLN